MSGIRYTRDFNLKSLKLLTSKGVIDVRYIMTEISIYEDLFSNIMSGYVMLTESVGYAEFLNLNGSDYIYIDFDKDGTGNPKPVQGWFRIYKIDGRELAENMSTETYRLHFCSEELFISEQYKISKSYVSQSIKDIILDICGKNGDGTGSDAIKTLKITKPLELEDTKGLYSFIIPNLKPFDAINWLSVYAQPQSKYIGADMLFYENRDGFHFKSLQNLMAGQNSSTVMTYEYSPKNLFGPTDGENLTEGIVNAFTYEILESYDTLKNVAHGVFANRLISVDILTRKVKTTEFDYFKYQAEAGSLNKNKVIDNTINRHGDQLNQTSNACLKLVFSNFDQHDPANAQRLSTGISPTSGFPSVAPNIDAEVYIPYRTAQLSLANYTRLRISVPGDPELAVGKKIKFNLLTNASGQKFPNQFYSGNYLITAVRHLLNQSEYKTVLEIAKESVPISYANNPNGQGSWTKAIS